MVVKALVLYGEGLNCDKETKHAFELVGANAERVLISELLEGEKKLEDYQIFAIPGGFSGGDFLGAGKFLANKMKAKIGDQIDDYIKSGNLIIGICNGFQVLAKYPLLPDPTTSKRSITLSYNDSGRFVNRWVYLTVNPKSSIFLRELDSMTLPVRHAEGKFIPKDDEVMKRLNDNGQVALHYTEKTNPNGSIEDVAGICDKTGRIFGLMPHPEAALDFTNTPNWTQRREYHKRDYYNTDGEEIPKEGPGRKIFENAVNFALEELV
jgi:phosphoribosylformylglycinamidine synthase